MRSSYSSLHSAYGERIFFSANDACKMLGYGRQAVYKLLNEFERNNLVAKKTCREDGRQKLYRLKCSGKILFANKKFESQPKWVCNYFELLWKSLGEKRFSLEKAKGILSLSDFATYKLVNELKKAGIILAERSSDDARRKNYSLVWPNSALESGVAGAESGNAFVSSAAKENGFGGINANGKGGVFR